MNMYIHHSRLVSLSKPESLNLFLRVEVFHEIDTTCICKHRNTAMNSSPSNPLFPNLVDVFPQTLTILVTYQCTAACPQCCFECTPQIKGRIPTHKILNYIDAAHESFPNLKLIVFSGGECFLLGDDLVTIVSHAHGKGLSVRCVTNGYWGKNFVKCRPLDG